MKTRIIITFLSVFLIGIHHSKTQSIYGLSGFNKIPDAYIIENGKVAFALAYFHDDATKQENHVQTNITQFSYCFLVGVVPRLEVGYRRIALLDVDKIEFNPRNFYVDQMFNVKFRFIKEKKYFPQLSVGIQDVIGTGMFQSSFIVLSKKIDIKENSFFTATAGFGTKFMDLVTGTYSEKKARDYRFIGFFGGMEGQFNKYFSLMGEYDAQDWNFGIMLKYKDFFRTKVFINDFNNLGGQISLRFNI
ncbi:MAG: YjbH domain-containing protein [Bacteroidales bacterium]|nr:YjbH domain-containing protein [Bacteroidales bacterium]